MSRWPSQLSGQGLHFPLFVSLISLLFSFLAWDRFLNFGDQFDRHFASYGILVSGILYSLSAGLIAWDQRRLLSKLTLAQDLTERIFESMIHGFVLLDSKGRISRINRAAAELIGYSERELEGRLWFEFCPKKMEDAIWPALLKDKSVSIEQNLKSKHRGEVPVYMVFSQLKNRLVDCEGMVCVAQDISEKRYAEARIAASLEEKEVMLREIHHRVKNNLQAIISLFNFQIRESDNGPSIQVLAECQNYIYTMAAIHETLYESKELSKINVRKFIDRISKTILQQKLPGCYQVILNIENEAYWGMDRAIMCGLLLHELLTNLITSSGNDKEPIRIWIHYQCEPENDSEQFVIGKNGANSREPLEEVENAGILSPKIIPILIEQLQATWQISRNGKLEHIIRIPLKQKAEEAA